MNFNSSKTGKEATFLLYEGSYKAIPFNVLLAFLLACDLARNQVPLLNVSIWFLAIFAISIFRYIFAYVCSRKKILQNTLKRNLHIFLLSTLLMGSAWGSCYLMALPYINPLHEFIIILVFGGMSAGSIASLSIYMPAYYAYIIPMFLPVIIYNYSLFDFDRTILATMFALFVIMVAITANLNKNLLNTIILLSTQKESLIKQLKVMSITDSLTNLYNRRYFEEILNRELDKAKHNQHTLSLILIDIDNFKIINDTFGHPYGDILLTKISEYLKKSFPTAPQSLFRVGGDEFAIILTDTPLKEIQSICKSIKQNFQYDFSLHDINLSNYSPIFDQITLSMGVVHVKPGTNASFIEQITNVVDKALYEAKHEGKNQIIVKELA